MHADGLQGSRLHWDGRTMLTDAGGGLSNPGSFTGIFIINGLACMDNQTLRAARKKHHGEYFSIHIRTLWSGWLGCRAPQPAEDLS